MDDRLTVQFFFQFPFDVVDGVVQGKDIPIGGYFCVQGNDDAAGTVIMYH